VRIHDVKLNPKSPLPFEPFEWNYVIFTRINHAPVRRIYVYRPVKVWDEEFHSSDRILKTHFGLKYEIGPLTHKLGVLIHLDVKQNVPGFFTGVPRLFPETVTRENIPMFNTRWYFQF
jgi:hypothetical protein